MLLERAAVFGAGPLVATEQQIQVPSGTGKDADSAEWVLSGTLNIRTEDGAKSPK